MPTQKKHFRHILSLLFFVMFLSALVFTFSSQSGHFERSSVQASADWPSTRDLYGKLREIRKVLFVYGTVNPEIASAYRDFAQNQLRARRWLEIVVKPDTAVTSEDIKSYPLFVVGALGSNELLDKMSGSLPFEMKNGTISLGQLLKLEEQDVYTLSFFPNPLERSLPLSLATGKSDDKILDFLRNSRSRSFFRSGEFAVFRNGQRIVLGFFKQQGDKPWSVDHKTTRTFLPDESKSLRTVHFQFNYHGSGSPHVQLEPFAKSREQRLTRLLTVLADVGIDTTSLPTIDYHLYESLEDKGLRTHNTDLSHFDLDKSEVHAVLNTDLIGDDFYSDAKLLFLKLVGRSASQALEDGVGIYFSEGWGRRGYQSWVRVFHATGNLVPLRQLLDSEFYRRQSYLFMRPLAGSLVAFLVDRYGWQTFVELYRDWPERGLPQGTLKTTGFAELERGWLAYLDKLPPPEKTSVARKTPDLGTEFHKGFCYAHEGYRIYNGYLSRKSWQSLQKLASLGTNWISLSPFGYLRDPNKPDHFRFSFGAGAENDESLITATLYARKLGMGVMLKPHVLMSGPHWGWPGDVKMSSDEEWQIFFDRYYNWLRHYALLAEMYEMDMLCIGVELMQTTRDHQDEWRHIIAKIRRIYSGPIVYAANWWQEFEQITFWDDLDYIGLNCYYPLSEKETVTLEDLKQGAQKFLPVIEAVARKHNKPVLLTEVGFTSTAKNWQNPHERRRGVSVDLQDQVLCYRAIFETFRGHDWFHGFYWWKWPTYLEYGGESHSGFTPNGKPAEAVIAEWYSKPWNRVTGAGY